ncbi:MAG: PorT family protein [Tannerella sp.]|jgi:hypothetical protein|nr:PorT family protein [Tannerella sp.]
MKKIILTAVLFGLCLQPIRAQTKIEEAETLTWGLKAEANLSNFILSGLPDNAKSTMQAGASGGGILNVKISERFAVQGDLLFHFKSSVLDINGTKNDFHYWGEELAIYAMMQLIKCNSGRAYVGIGPYSEFGFSATNKVGGKTTDLYEKDEETGVSLMGTSNSGFGIMIGYEFNCGIQINAGYKASITDVLEKHNNKASLFPTAISLGIGYRFGK